LMTCPNKTYSSEVCNSCGLHREYVRDIRLCDCSGAVFSIQEGLSGVVTHRDCWVAWNKENRVQAVTELIEKVKSERTYPTLAIFVQHGVKCCDLCLNNIHPIYLDSRRSVDTFLSSLRNYLIPL